MNYQELNQKMSALLEGVENNISNLANASALLYEELDDINWVGFYLLVKNELILGPFQGKIACTKIAIGKGVCGTAVKEKKTQLVKNVHKFEGHIACDARSNSEIVIPLFNEDKVFGVLDIDSELLARFDENDQIGLELIAKTIEGYLR